MNKADPAGTLRGPYLSAVIHASGKTDRPDVVLRRDGVMNLTCLLGSIHPGRDTDPDCWGKVLSKPPKFRFQANRAPLARFLLNTRMEPHGPRRVLRQAAGPIE